MRSLVCLAAFQNERKTEQGGPSTGWGVRITACSSASIARWLRSPNLFALLATAAALYAFLQVGKVIEQTTKRQVPSTIVALLVSRQAERVAATASGILAATNKTQQDEVSATSRMEVGRL